MFAKVFYCAKFNFFNIKVEAKLVWVHVKSFTVISETRFSSCRPTQMLACNFVLVWIFDSLCVWVWLLFSGFLVPPSCNKEQHHVYHLKQLKVVQLCIVLQHKPPLSSVKRKLSLSLCVQPAHLWGLLQSSGDRYRRARPHLQRERGCAPQTGGAMHLHNRQFSWIESNWSQSIASQQCYGFTILSTASFQECSKRANNGKFSLRDLLVVPMQRVLKYHLLLQVGFRVHWTQVMHYKNKTSGFYHEQWHTFSTSD